VLDDVDVVVVRGGELLVEVLDVDGFGRVDVEVLLGGLAFPLVLVLLPVLELASAAPEAVSAPATASRSRECRRDMITPIGKCVGDRPPTTAVYVCMERAARSSGRFHTGYARDPDFLSRDFRFPERRHSQRLVTAPRSKEKRWAGECNRHLLDLAQHPETDVR
jgi:hypothetical protein